MPVDLFSSFLGFLLGVVATAIAWQLTVRTVRNPEKSKLTGVWSLRDVTAPGSRPVVVAEEIRGMSLPPGTKVLVPSGRLDNVPDEVLSTCEVRMHGEVHLNAAIGRDRALVFSGHIVPRTAAVFTMDEVTVRRLQADFQRMWNESTPYIETAQVSELARKDGRIVDVTGKAMEVMEYRGRKMMRLTDGKVAVGVVTDDDVSAHSGTMVRVVGRIKREGGYAYLHADRIESVAAPVAA